MGWNDDEQENIKKGMSLSSKILLVIIICILLIILVLLMILMNMKESNYSIYKDGVVIATSKNTLLTTIDNITYVDIEEFSKLVGYEYHKGEYKSSVVEENKWYVEGKEETASFYINDNKIYKLPVNQLDTMYNEYVVENAVKCINEKPYASLDAIAKAFNVVLDETNSYLKIYTLDYLVTLYDANVIKWGYTSIIGQNLENRKAILYGYLIVKKDGRII